MPRSRKPERGEERSLRESEYESGSDDDEEQPLRRYDRQFDHPNAVAITSDGQEDAVTFYSIEVYSGDPPMMKWEVEKRYSQVDAFRKDLLTVKGWKKELEEYEFPVKRMTALDDEAQRDRKTKLETWLNSVLALAVKKRTRKSSDKGVQKCDDFLGPDSAADVRPVEQAATVDKSNVSYDREDQRAANKVLKSRRDAEKRDPNFKSKAKRAKEEAITSPHSPGGDSSDDSSSDSDDEETCIEDAVEIVQEHVSACCSMMQKLCVECVATCKQYAKVDDEDEDEDEEDDRKRTRPKRAATAPSKMQRRGV